MPFIKGIELVLNYDIPESAGDYVHRIGRTGRAGSSGKAISFVLPDQRNKVREIERLIRSTIPISQLPELPYIPYVKPERESFQKTHSNNSRSGGYKGKNNFRKRY